MAKQEKNQQLTLNQIVQEDKKYDELKEVIFEDGRFTEVYKKFRPSLIEEMFEDFSQFLAEYESKIGDMSGKKTLDYLNLFILIHFSKLVDTLPESFEEKVDVLKVVLDLEVAEEIIQAFDKREIQKVYDHLWKKLEAASEAVEANKVMKEKLRDTILNSKMKNKDLILKAISGEQDA